MKYVIAVFVTIVALGLGACRGPVEEANTYIAKLDEERTASKILDGGVARRVNCALAVRHAYNKRTGTAQVWTYRAGPDSLIECFDSEGFSSTEELTPLRKISDFEVEEIRGNPKCYPLPAAPPPTSRPTPAPDLSEGTCCP